MTSLEVIIRNKNKSYSCDLFSSHRKNDYEYDSVQDSVHDILLYLRVISRYRQLSETTFRCPPKYRLDDKR